MWGMWLGAEKNPDDSEPISLGSFWGQTAIGTNKKNCVQGGRISEAVMDSASLHPRRFVYLCLPGSRSARTLIL